MLKYKYRKKQGKTKGAMKQNIKENDRIQINYIILTTDMTKLFVERKDSHVGLHVHLHAPCKRTGSNKGTQKDGG